MLKITNYYKLSLLIWNKLKKFLLLLSLYFLSCLKVVDDNYILCDESSSLLVIVCCKVTCCNLASISNALTHQVVLLSIRLSAFCLLSNDVSILKRPDNTTGQSDIATLFNN